ncbi:PDZ domain-containing protein [Candidatus Omnitrophota bacterium]
MRARICTILISTCLIFSISAQNAYSDSVTLKTGRIVKGVIVEDFHDRVVVSTYEGEVFLKKSDISRMHYDTEDQSMIHLAEMAVEKGKYSLAYHYYEKSLKINPESRKALDGKVYVQNFMFRKRKDKKMDGVERRNKYERSGVAILGQKSTADRKREIRKELGMEIELGGVNPQVMSVARGSPAYHAGIHKGDYLVAIWGRLTGYMNIEQIVLHLVEKTPLERKVTIERTPRVAISKERGFLPNINKLIGATFSMKLDGLTITDIKEGGAAFNAGLKKGDLVMSVNGSPTRYMPMKIAVEMIHNTTRDWVELTIRREVNLWET